MSQHVQYNNGTVNEVQQFVGIITRKSGNTWNIDEDQKLQQLMLSSKKYTWKVISQQLQTTVPRSKTYIKTPTMCMQRWTRVLNPIFIKGKWNIQEDYLLLKALKNTQIFARWYLIAKCVPGRTDVQVRQRTLQNCDWFVSHGALQNYLDIIYKFQNEREHAQHKLL
ncbi:Myb-like_DNA-binding domain-containing protein [Hexamita inflata]|uniref:Myb-like DNA-binding domain-containing protein n=1 Tax=Hexamita inflata TaxID=28002 RepID=A0AA86TL49_9EUKA|nr:Myb-like DNA-binding domain-containing protein [Hexamita inflata]